MVMGADLAFRVAEVKQLDTSFWQAEEDALFALLFILIKKAALTGAQTALDGLLAVGVGVDWAVVNMAASDWARTYTYQLVKGITASSRNYLQNELVQWIDSGQPIDALAESIAPMFGKVRAQMIAVTEVTRAFASGNDAAWRESNVVWGFDVFTAEDDRVCPICSDVVAHNPYQLGDFAGEMPFHVNCRCWKSPIIKEPPA
jgi:SPP1 gp7 family putative phage head morphogenesis protein